ncbi:sugar transferase [Enterococcus cecorum]|uniref:sugar transferase n=1 Tax=Enterococcus cecorum TaxID=44008 RepID=UPI000A66FF42|nr:sugar transferase [Enterococcus cecorum]MDZ5561304.1 sugar transferase [Enterococcus cecorum]CAI3433730.1 sugar transferase [Enterococcus cecorum]
MIRKVKLYEKYGKRLQDIVLSTIALIVLSPLLIVIYFLVRYKLGTPVFFVQDRPGRNGKIFRLYKFRTMIDKKDSNGEVLSDEQRLTPFGKKLRSTSLDELPELINIIKGDMSIVGPRPLLVKYLPLYNEQQARRHEVRPGLTGFAQVNGRNSITWEQKFDLDVYYVDHVTFIQDCKIIFKTIHRVIFKEGITSANSSTMEEFLGNKSK